MDNVEVPSGLSGNEQPPQHEKPGGLAYLPPLQEVSEPRNPLLSKQPPHSEVSSGTPSSMPVAGPEIPMPLSGTFSSDREAPQAPQAEVGEAFSPDEHVMHVIGDVVGLLVAPETRGFLEQIHPDDIKELSHWTSKQSSGFSHTEFPQLLAAFVAQQVRGQKRETVASFLPPEQQNITFKGERPHTPDELNKLLGQYSDTFYSLLNEQLPFRKMLGISGALTTEAVQTRRADLYVAWRKRMVMAPSAQVERLILQAADKGRLLAQRAESYPLNQDIEAAWEEMHQFFTTELTDPEQQKQWLVNLFQPYAQNPIDITKLTSLEYREVTDEYASELAGQRITRGVWYFANFDEYEYFQTCMWGKNESFGVQIPGKVFIGGFLQQTGLILATPHSQVEKATVQHEVLHTVDTYPDRLAYNRVIEEALANYPAFMKGIIRPLADMESDPTRLKNYILVLSDKGYYDRYNAQAIRLQKPTMTYDDYCGRVKMVVERIALIQSQVGHLGTVRILGQVRNISELMNLTQY